MVETVPPVSEPIVSERARSLAGVRILIAIGPLVLGGAERQAMLLARTLSERFGASVAIWAIYDTSRQLVPWLEEQRIAWRLVHGPVVASIAPVRYKLRQFRRFVRFAAALRRERFDVLMPFMTEPGIVVSLAGRLAAGLGRGPVCIWNERSNGSESRPPKLHRAARLATRFVTAFIANSRAGAEYLVRELGVDGSRVNVIDNGVALAPARRARQEWRRELGAGDRDIVATMIGNLHPPKDQATLVRAWSIMRERLASEHAATAAGGRIILALAGRFVETHEELQRLAAELGVVGDVRFLGPVDDVPGLLTATDIGVFSSMNEGTPNGVLECMAAGLPVVATDVGGIRDALGAGGERFLVAVGDARAFADAVVELAGDPTLRRAVGEANRRMIEERFGPDRMAAEFAKVILDTYVARTGAAR